MNNRYIVLSAQIISTLFTPFYMPTVAFVVILMFSYLSQLSFAQKFYMVFMVYLFTMLLPRTIIYFYRKHNGWSRKQLSVRARRYVPYAISIFCYTLLLAIMRTLHLPHFTVPVVASALILQITCAIVNNWIKVSVHAAASGGVIGMLFAFSIVFDFNAIWWIALCILLCGCVCSARMVLRQHTYSELLTGVIIGFISGWMAVIVI